VSRPLTLLESADLLGRWRYVELAAFAQLGRRASECATPALSAYLAGASRAHGWRAVLVEELLPVSAGLPGPESWTQAPSREIDEAFVAVVGGDDAEVLDALLGAVYPSMAAGYAERLAVVSRAADPPVVRAVGRLLADLDTIRRDGALLAGDLPPASSARRRRIEELVSRGGGVFGPIIAGSPTGSSRSTASGEGVVGGS